MLALGGSGKQKMEVGCTISSDQKNPQNNPKLDQNWYWAGETNLVSELIYQKDIYKVHGCLASCFSLVVHLC